MAEIDVFELAHKVPIVETISCYIQLQYKNGKYYGLCPFHKDTSIGSFVVFPDIASEKRGWFQCYACGEKGDNIDFVRKYLSVGYRDAAIIIAKNANLIREFDAANLGVTKLDFKDVVPLQRTVPAKPYMLAKRKSPEHLDKVYRCFVAASNPLTSQLKEVLLSLRRVPEYSLGKYFLFPQVKDLGTFWSKFSKKLMQEFNVTKSSSIDDLLIGVPGFYVGKGGRVRFQASYEEQLGIMIFDRKGRVSGIQTRTAATLDGACQSKKEKAARYKFLSSGYANGTSKEVGKLGCSCGFIEDILFPGNGWNRTIAVTEGRFKAEILASLGFLVVNMHSISNWKAAGNAAAELAAVTPAEKFILCYDSEKSENLLQSAYGIYNRLCQTLPAEFAVWDSSFGKGIDDVINAGYINKISRISAQEYFNINSAA